MSSVHLQALIQKPKIETRIESPIRRKDVSDTDFERLSKLISLYKNQKIQMATISDNTTWTHCLRLNFTLLNYTCLNI